jgi:hypothetical protein
VRPSPLPPPPHRHPDHSRANSPTGLDLHLTVPQNEDPNSLSTPPVRGLHITLPRGVRISPSVANGLSACTPAQIGLETDDAVSCPDASRLGEVSLATPLLREPLRGSVYLATPRDNPTSSLFALYLVLADAKNHGILIKLPGRIDLDRWTGQISITFSALPQLPFEDLKVTFRSGPRAPLVNPPELRHPHDRRRGRLLRPARRRPRRLQHLRDLRRPERHPCPPDSAHRPFHPDFSGGTLNPVAGSYSTFLFRLGRTDDEQELSQANTFLPPGLLAKIAGIPLCPDSALASISTELGAGAGESTSPACPAASQIGTVSAGLGAGPGPSYFPGKVYLAGPYKGAPSPSRSSPPASPAPSTSTTSSSASTPRPPASPPSPIPSRPSSTASSSA